MGSGAARGLSAVLSKSVRTSTRTVKMFTVDAHIHAHANLDPVVFCGIELASCNVTAAA